MKGFTPCELADEVAEKATKGVSKANKGGSGSVYQKGIDKLKDLREQLPNGKKYKGTDAFGNPVGNVAHSTANIEGYQIPDMKSHSKIGSRGKNGIKNPVDGWVTSVENPRYSEYVKRVDRNNVISESGTLRNNDTEYKIFEKYNSILKGNSEATGTINVYSERTVCPSCDNVAKAFSRDYPNLEIGLIDSSGKVYILKNGEIIR